MKKLSAVSKKILDTRLRFKHFVLTGSVIFIIMISIALFLIVQNTRIMREQISSDFNQQQLVLAHQVSSQIRSELSVIEGEIASLANFIDKGANKKVIDDAMEAMAERTHPIGVTVVALVDIEKRIVNYCAPGSQFKVDFDLIIECSSEADLEHSVLGPLYVEPGDTESVIIAGLLCKKVRLKNSFNGVFVVKIDISQLIKNVTSEIRSGRTGYAWVINKDGMFLYHPESEFVGRNAFTARQERQSYISFAQINHIMKDQMLKGEEGTGKYESGWHRGMMGRMEKLIAYTPVKSAVLSGERVWSVAVAAPITEVAEAVDRVYIRNTMAEGAIIIGMFVFVVLMIIYQRRMSRELKHHVSEKEQYI